MLGSQNGPLVEIEDLFACLHFIMKGICWNILTRCLQHIGHIAKTMDIWRMLDNLEFS